MMNALANLLKSKILIGIILIVVVFFISSKLGDKTAPAKDPGSSAPVTQTTSPQVVSTKPLGSDKDILMQDQPIEITFNKPLENTGEFKHRLEPEIKYKLEISPDRKTVKIIPQEPYLLGTEYTLFIKPETKFDGAQNLGEEKIYHFKTIQYRGV